MKNRIEVSCLVAMVAAVVTIVFLAGKESGRRETLNAQLVCAAAESEVAK